MKREHRAHRRQVDVAARLVRLRLQRESEVVSLVEHVLAEEVERVAEPLQAIERRSWRRRSPRLRARPRRRRSSRRARRPDRWRASSSAARRPAPAASLRVNAPSRKAGSVNRLVVAIGTTMPVSLSACLKSRTMRSRSAGVASIGHEIVVVEVDAPRANLGQEMHDLDRRTWRAHRLAKGVAADDCRQSRGRR